MQFSMLHVRVITSTPKKTATDKSLIEIFSLTIRQTRIKQQHGTTKTSGGVRYTGTLFIEIQLN